MTKPIIVVKICYKLLYVIQVVKVTSWPQLISKFLVAHTHLQPCTFFTPRVFLFSIIYVTSCSLFQRELTCISIDVQLYVYA